MSKKDLARVSAIILQRLENRDLSKWQKACKSLAPPHYDNTTRSHWFNENKFRIQVGREIITFVDEMTAILQNDNTFHDMRTSVIRSGIIKGIRDAEKKQKISQYLLNDVKFAALRTLVSWMDNPEKLKIAGREQRKSDDARPRGRKKVKGKYVPPRFELVREWELVGNDSIRLMLVVSNDYIHPYQNVEIEIEFGPNLAVTGVSPYSWIPDQNILRVGFIEANLGVKSFETPVMIELKMQKRQRDYIITGKLHYDNCDRGYRDQSKPQTTTVKMS